MIVRYTFIKNINIYFILNQYIEKINYKYTIYGVYFLIIQKFRSGVP